jgi:DNA-binding phage protein
LLTHLLSKRARRHAPGDHVSRSSLYKTLSKRGNPEFGSILKLLHGMGMRLTVEPDLAE